MNKNILAVIILAIVTIVLLVFLFFPKSGQAPANQVGYNSFGGIEVASPASNEVVASPLKIIGKVNGAPWIGFEGQVGTVKLIDDGGVVLGTAILTAKGEWMQQIIDFETTLTFKPTKKKSGSLVFYNENPSGDPERDKIFSLTVQFK